ncbi:uncharacterized protein LOC34624242 [Cyclospora cayetanensis]|uniref:Uncharacterized protein LOC34624242 n=1 Tax=Cyclospora cayetanensis TaxID=88456 RepID=A0A6P6S2S9_9EIME|nr:uncharacterized protein LOC34624242 [Cyclospora cayetanensis]
MHSSTTHSSAAAESSPIQNPVHAGPSLTPLPLFVSMRRLLQSLRQEPAALRPESQQSAQKMRKEATKHARHLRGEHPHTSAAQPVCQMKQSLAPLPDSHSPEDTLPASARTCNTRYTRGSETVVCSGSDCAAAASTASDASAAASAAASQVSAAAAAAARAGKTSEIDGESLWGDLEVESWGFELDSLLSDLATDSDMAFGAAFGVELEDSELFGTEEGTLAALVTEMVKTMNVKDWTAYFALRVNAEKELDLTNTAEALVLFAEHNDAWASAGIAQQMFRQDTPARLSAVPLDRSRLPGSSKPPMCRCCSYSALAVAVASVRAAAVREAGLPRTSAATDAALYAAAAVCGEGIAAAAAAELVAAQIVAAMRGAYAVHAAAA